jgi:hypothetical protein
MYKKSMATALLVCSIPAVASASWFLSTQVKTGGGSLTTRNMDNQTVQNLAVYKSYTASQGSLAVTAAADDGFTLKSLMVNGAPVVGNAVAIDGSDKNISAVFAPVLFGASATFSDGNGSVSPASVGNLYKGYELKSDLVFTFSPKYGYAMGPVLNVPVDPKVTTTPVNGLVKVTFKKGYVFGGSLNLTATATATAAANGFNQIAPQTVVSGATVNLAATGLNVGSTYTWSYVSGPANVAVFGNYTAVDKFGHKDTKVGYSTKPGPAISLTQSGNSVSFAAPATPGQYKFTVTDGTYVKMATVNVIGDRIGFSTLCQSCHTANGIGRSTLSDEWAASAHNAGGHLPGCSECHYGTATGGHPGNTSTASVDKDTLLVTNPAGATISHYGVKTVAQGQYFCTGCHSSSGTYAVPHSMTPDVPPCANCHTTSGNGDAHTISYTLPFAEPTATDNCATCHTNTAPYQNKVAPTNGIQLTNNSDCTSCHAFDQSHVGAGFVKDNNNGVRAVMGEFTKWSHHIVNPNGLAPKAEQCAVCHLEGTVKDGALKVDPTKHMVDNRTHLRNADTDADYAWNPAQPDHTLMDNFCLSCHDADGATSVVSKQLQGLITPLTGKTASPSNPFGDTLSNRYDKMQRPAVVDAKGQFNLSNPSHHAVLGQKYSGRTRVAGDPRAVKTVFNANSSAALPGKRSTIYDSRVSRATNGDGYGAYNVSKFVEAYQTLSPAPGTTDKTLGDDSVLHCGDCHTVGQYRQADVNVLPKNKAVIGAHGSNNEYMLRNFAGTDERHVGQKYSADASKNAFFVGTNPLGPKYNQALTAAELETQPWLVCFNCHSYQNYGSIGSATGASGVNHAGEYANGNRCNGPINTIPFEGYTTGTLTDGEQYVTRLGELTPDTVGQIGATSGDTDFSNVFGMQCANCHNSGLKNSFGGIHGSKVQTYTDANGSQQKAYRFLPGLGNTMYVPGNASGTAAGMGSVSDLNWEVKSIGTTYNTAKDAVIDNGGCYTLVPETGPENTAGQTVAAEAPYSVSPAYEQKDVTGSVNMFGTWGGCDDHRGNAHGKAFSTGTVQGKNTAGANTGWIDPTGGTYNTGGAGVVRKVQRPVSY